MSSSILIALLGTLVGAGVVTFLVTPLVIRYARKHDLVDQPGTRKIHKSPVPRLGGIAVFFGLLTPLITYGVLFKWESLWGLLTNEHHLSLLIPCAIVFVLGLADDVWGLKPGPRIIVETLAASLLMQAGFVIDVVWFPFTDPIHLGLFAFPVTLLWFIGVTNAFNLIDGLDGLMSSVGISSLLGCVGIALLGGRPVIALFALALVGALCGFLPWNWHKARVFLGDSGSLLVGLATAALALEVSRNDAGVLAFHIPLALCALPIGETFLTLARRYASGQPYFSADQSHIHHIILAKGLTVPRAVLVLGLIQAVFAATAVLSRPLDPFRALIPMGIALLIAIYSVRWLGYLELRVLWDRLRHRLFRPRREEYSEIVAIARAGEVLRGMSSVSELKDGLRAAVTKGRFAFIALELSSHGERLLNSEPPVMEPRNREAAAYAAGRNGLAGWLVSMEAADLDPELAHADALKYIFNLASGDRHYGRLVCLRFHRTHIEALGSQDVRRYLVEPIEEFLQSLDSAAKPASQP